jgi:prepilin-type N-terminal cleavage/methylation domain-containing protein
MEDSIAATIMTTTHTRRGFTLIELMIVIAIISILAAILIPNFMHARAESVTSSCEMNEKMLATAEEEYSVDNGGAYVAFGSLTTPYLTTVPTDPVKKGNTYTITTTIGAYGSYQITDAGGHDTTTTISIIQDGSTTACSACTSVVWDQNSGVRGK